MNTENKKHDVNWNIVLLLFITLAYLAFNKATLNKYYQLHTKEIIEAPQLKYLPMHFQLVDGKVSFIFFNLKAIKFYVNFLLIENTVTDFMKSLNIFRKFRDFSNSLKHFRYFTNSLMTQIHRIIDTNCSGSYWGNRDQQLKEMSYCCDLGLKMTYNEYLQGSFTCHCGYTPYDTRLPLTRSLSIFLIQVWSQINGMPGDHVTHWATKGVLLTLIATRLMTKLSLFTSNITARVMAKWSFFARDSTIQKCLS